MTITELNKELEKLRREMWEKLGNYSESDKWTKEDHRNLGYFMAIEDIQEMIEETE
jgi:hypothetical protein